MIKFQRIAAPIELTPEVVADKTSAFKADPRNRVWDEPYIKTRLMKMTNDKCCYCECRLGEGPVYMEVEHFHHKGMYPDEVVCWDNLLPSCRTCNANKGAHDTVANPIVNPGVDDPKDHFNFKDFRYKWKTPEGKETVILLSLNDTEKKCMPRYRVCTQLITYVEDLVEDIKSVTAESRLQEKNRMKRKVRELLEMCQSDREFTAFKATTMVNSSDYAELVDEMQSRGLWTEDMIELDTKMREYAFDVK